MRYEKENTDNSSFHSHSGNWLDYYKEHLLFSLLLFILRDNQLMNKLNSHTYTSLMNCIHDMLETNNPLNVTHSSTPKKPTLYEYSEKR